MSDNPLNSLNVISYQGRDLPLTVTFDGKHLAIAIGINVLAHAAHESDFFNAYDPAVQDYNLKLKVRDYAAFANTIARLLENEDAEDGSSPFTRLLDEMFIKAAEDCDSGVEEIKHG